MELYVLYPCSSLRPIPVNFATVHISAKMRSVGPGSVELVTELTLKVDPD
jgi:hypothetical protein